MSAVFAILISIPLLYLPGWLLARVAGRRLDSSDLLEQLYERILVGALLQGWLAFTLAELGLFTAWLHLTLLALMCIPAWYWIARQRPPAPLGFNALVRPAATPSRQAAGVRLNAVLGRYWDAVALATIGIVFCVLTVRPFEVVLGVRDAAVYSNGGFAIARTGGIAQYDSIVAEIAHDQHSDDANVQAAAAQAETNLLGVQPRTRNIATRLRAAGFLINDGDLDAGRVIPQGFHLFPAWIALLTALTDQRGGLWATGLMGLLGVWSVGMLARKLAGAWAGVLAALLLALNGAQVWFSRYSTAEAITQFLTFAGLYCFAACLAATSGRRTRFLALLCGISIGQLALARIDFALVVAPLLAYLFYTWLSRRWQALHTWMAVGLGAMLVHAAIHIATIARAYFFDTLFARLQDYAITALVALPFLTPALRELYLLRPCSPLGNQPCPPVAGMDPTRFEGWNYQRIAAELALVIALAFAALAVRRWGRRPLAALEGGVQRYASALLGLSAVGLGLVAGYAYLVRPQILNRATLAAIPSCLAPGQLRTPQGACLQLQGYIGAPIASPAYIDHVAAWGAQLTHALRGKPIPGIEACVAFRQELLPPNANGRTSVELRRDGLVDPVAIGAERWRTLQECDAYVLRDLFANSQANLVRVGWYVSPFGLALGVIGLALLWRRMNGASWLFLIVALVSTLVFVRLTYGTSDQHYIYIMRRYVPAVYPALCIGMAYALVWLARLNAQARLKRLASGAAIVLAIALVGFNIATNLKIYRHTEYQGALDQIAAIAATFEPDDVVLLRGGAPTYGAARDIPDNLATPLTYAFGLNAFTIKSEQPGKYARQLAEYVSHWQSEGRDVFLILGPSGAVALPGFELEAVGPAQLYLSEFEQPVDQKPTNVQEYVYDAQIYRVTPGTAPAASSIAPDTYAAQVRGFYRAETIDGQEVAWTNGDALIRIARPDKSQTLTLDLQLAGGATRPQRFQPTRVCVSSRVEARPWPEDPDAPPWSEPHCFDIGANLAHYTATILPTPEIGETILVRISSDTWIPARDDPQQHDGRLLGVQFGGMTTSVVESRATP